MGDIEQKLLFIMMVLIFGVIIVIAFLTYSSTRYGDCMYIARVSGNVTEAVIACGEP